MRRLPKPAYLSISIDEWRAAQRKLDAVEMSIDWRQARNDPVVVNLFKALPTNELVRKEFADGRSELAFKAWKGIRFGEGRTIFEAAKHNYEAWVGSLGDTLARNLAEARERLAKILLPYVPDFYELSSEEQVEIPARTSEKLNMVQDSINGLISHLDHVTPRNKVAKKPRINPLANVRAAVFTDIMNSRRAGQLLGIPLPDSDKNRHENQTVRQSAVLGRQLLHYHYGEAEWQMKAARMRGYIAWWDQFYSIEDVREQVHALVAKARGTSAMDEKRRAEQDGFSATLDKWAPVVERRLEIQEIQDQNKAARISSTTRRRRPSTLGAVTSPSPGTGWTSTT